MRFSRAVTVLVLAAGIVAAAFYGPMLFAPKEALATTSGGNIDVTWNFSEPIVGDLATGTFPHTSRYSQTILAGTGAGRADLTYSKRYTIAAGATQTIDMKALVNAKGTTIGFVKLVGWYIYNDTGNSLTLEPGASNGFTARWGGTSPTTIIPGKAFELFYNDTGYAVGSSTKTIDITNDGATSATVLVRLLGRSA